VTENEAKTLGLSPHAIITQHPKTGESGYRVGVEVFQQLRCLDLLRQAAYRNTRYPRNADADLGMWELPRLSWELVCLHVSDYCVELLRETLMCHGDSGIFSLTEQGSGGISGARLGFEGSKVCRSFEALRTWSQEHSAR
jgi:hypothetical protein